MNPPALRTFARHQPIIREILHFSLMVCSEAEIVRRPVFIISFCHYVKLCHKSRHFLLRAMHLQHFA